MSVLQEIQDLLKVDEMTAKTVEQWISGSGFSFSNCTKRQFNAEVRESYEFLESQGMAA